MFHEDDVDSIFDSDEYYSYYDVCGHVDVFRLSEKMFDTNIVDRVNAIFLTISCCLFLDMMMMET